MGFFDRVHCAFNPVMSLWAEMVILDYESAEKIKNLLRKINSLAKQVQGLHEILWHIDQDAKKFTDNETVEVDSQDSEDSQDQTEEEEGIVLEGAT